jgi:hypothetical protein
MQKEITAPLMQRIERAMGEFPELSKLTITVGLNRSDELHGSADSRNMTIRLNPRLRGGVTYATIGHDLFLDDVPFYLCSDLWKRKTWPTHANTVRSLCMEAIRIRQTNRHYKMWLEESIREYLDRTQP